MGLKVYLGGSIKGKDFDSANGWRQYAEKALLHHGHEPINPMRNRVWNTADEQVKFTMSEIIHRDLRDVDRSDVLLVEYENPCEHQYVGTITEMTRARMKDKIVVVFTSEGVSTFGWLESYLATRIFTSLEEALNYIIKVID